MKKKIITLLIVILIVTGITFLAGIIKVDSITLRRIINIGLNLLNGLTAFIAIKLTGIKIDIELKNFKQYLIGLIVAILLSLNFAFMPTLLGLNMVGNHVDFNISKVLFAAFYYFIIIGPVEELLFRVYIQETCMSFFNKKWIGVILGSLIFGLWHWINSGFFAVLITFAIGLVFGFSKYFIKKFNYLGISFSHGLYDFLNTIYSMFLV